MSYRIELAPSVARALKKLDKTHLDRIVPKIDALAAEPRPHGVEKLSGCENRYRLRIGDYRVIYTIEDAARLVTVAVVAHRREAYR